MKKLDKKLNSDIVLKKLKDCKRLLSEIDSHSPGITKAISDLENSHDPYINEIEKEIKIIKLCRQKLTS